METYFFLKQDTFFYKKMYFWHFYSKMHTGLHRGLHYNTKSVYQKIYFLISQPKHMLWVLKRTVSMRRFFWAPKAYVKTDG